jgi:hypothetical protein
MNSSPPIERKNLNTIFKYLLATGSCIGYTFAYLNGGLLPLSGHDLGYANLVFLLVSIMLLGVNLLYFIPSSFIQIKFLLPAILTLSVLFLLLVYSEFQVKDIFAFVYVPFLINTFWGCFFFYLERIYPYKRE